jgi:ABC-2 type transport system ATP-binding protein
MASLRAAGTTVLEMQILQPDLEEVFIKIMSQASGAQAMRV